MPTRDEVSKARALAQGVLQCLSCGNTKRSTPVPVGFIAGTLECSVCRRATWWQFAPTMDHDEPWEGFARESVALDGAERKGRR